MVGTACSGLGLDQWFSVGVHMDPRGPCNIFGGLQAKHNKLGVHNDILGVHEENQLRMLFIFQKFNFYCKLLFTLYCVHCVIHHQHLVAKKMSACLHDGLTVVIKVVNHIKTNSL